MKQFVLTLLTIGSLIGCIPPLFAAPSTIDYALMPATPYNSEIALGRQRFEKFLAKANAKKRAVLAQNPVVAVQAYVLSAAEVGPILHRLTRGEIGYSDGGSPSDLAHRQVKFLLLFDSRTGQLVSDDGFLVLNTPSRGKIGVFGGISALYIGEGW